jgi:hypothetical protein
VKENIMAQRVAIVSITGDQAEYIRKHYRVTIIMRANDAIVSGPLTEVRKVVLIYSPQSTIS